MNIYLEEAFKNCFQWVKLEASNENYLSEKIIYKQEEIFNEANVNRKFQKLKYKILYE